MISIISIFKSVYNGIKRFVKTFIDITKKMLEYVTNAIIGVISGVVAVVRWVDFGIALLVNKFYSYNKNTNKWIETVVTQEIDENEVPEHIRNKMEFQSGNDIDMTHELEMQLS